MNRSIRQLIREDFQRDFQEPRHDLTLRVLQAIPDSRPERATQRVFKPAMQTLGVVLVGLLIAAVIVGVRVARGDVALPAGFPLGVGGLHPPAAPYSIVDGQYLSADTAWIVAQLHVHNGPTVIMKTSDGGRTWQEQFRIPDGSSIGSFHFWNLRDGDLDTLVPTKVPPSKIPGTPGSSNMETRTYRTHDGGAHWQLLDRPVEWTMTFGSYFLSPNEGWRLTGVEPGYQGRTVQHTVDGGNTWTVVGTVSGTGTLAGELKFKDSLNGWIAIGESKGYSSDASGKMTVHSLAPPYLYATHDGGVTWAGQTLPLPVADADVRIESPIFFPGGDAILPFEVLPPPPGFASSGVMQSYVLQSHDGGRHWTNPVLTRGGLQQGGAMFLSASHWLTSDGPFLHETLDAGKTWSSRQVLANGLEFNFAPWDYIDGQTIWSQVGASRLVRSTDGGAHWSSISPPTIAN